LLNQIHALHAALIRNFLGRRSHQAKQINHL
jgi:hypothetical protein